MRIFEIKHSDGEREWFAYDGTNIGALRYYINHNDCDESGLEDSELIELPESEWDVYTVIDNENKEAEPKTFRQHVEEWGCPCIIAGTMYE